jgi:sulfofructosephosphate aldolase
MTTRPATQAPVAALARPGGTFAMVAMDQRDSLRTMMAEHTGRAPQSVTDEEMISFKLEVARTLGPLASAFLIDRHYGAGRVLAEKLLPGTCAPILAADALDQPPGGPVLETSLDTAVDPHAAARDGVAALKLLVIWRRDDLREQRIRLAERFVALCRDAGLASVLEPVARATPEEEAAGTFVLNDAVVEAARELAPLGPSLYKCQVPDRGVGTVAALTAQAERIDAVVPVPWVVLSQGVAPADFPRAVEAACRAGASGFLAGRALWTDALAAPDVTTALRTTSADRLRHLSDLVERHGRPWWEAADAAAPAGEGTA